MRGEVGDSGCGRGKICYPRPPKVVLEVTRGRDAGAERHFHIHLLPLPRPLSPFGSPGRLHRLVGSGQEKRGEEKPFFGGRWERLWDLKRNMPLVD